MSGGITWKDVGRTIGKAAPLIGSLLGGPMGAAAGSLVASTLGVEAAPDVVNVAAANPDALVKLKELEIKERSELLGWYTEQLRLEVEDRKSAREASVKGGDRFPLLVLSVFVLLVVFGLEGMAMFMPTTPGMSESSIGRILGGLDGLAFLIASYWFGGSLREQPSTHHEGLKK